MWNWRRKCHWPGKNFVALGPGDKLLKFAPTHYYNEYFYAFSASKSYNIGMSGGPVLNAKGEIGGMIVASSFNYVHVTRPEIIGRFLQSGNFFAHQCSHSKTMNHCIGEEMENLRQLALGGDSYAQYQLALLYRIDADSSPEASLHYLAQSAEGGFVPAKYLWSFRKILKGELANLDYLKESAEENYAPAITLLGQLYVQGTFRGGRKPFPWKGLFTSGLG